MHPRARALLAPRLWGSAEELLRAILEQTTGIGATSSDQGAIAINCIVKREWGIVGNSSCKRAKTHISVGHPYKSGRDIHEISRCIKVCTKEMTTTRQ